MLLPAFIKTESHPLQLSSVTLDLVNINTTLAVCRLHKRDLEQISLSPATCLHPWHSVPTPLYANPQMVAARRKGLHKTSVA